MDSLRVRLAADTLVIGRGAESVVGVFRSARQFHG
jgi:hypothetical protein